MRRAMNGCVTHCKHGHARTPESTYITPDGQLVCRVCRRGVDSLRRGRQGMNVGVIGARRRTHCIRGHRKVGETSAERKCKSCRRLIAKAKSHGRPRPRPKKPKLDLVSNALLREAVLDARRRDEFLTWTEIARRAEMFASGRPDTTRVRRAIGEARNGQHFYKRCESRLALAIMRAVDADPFEVGL